MQYLFDLIMFNHIFILILMVVNWSFIVDVFNPRSRSKPMAFAVGVFEFLRGLGNSTNLNMFLDICLIYKYAPADMGLTDLTRWVHVFV